VRRVTGKPHEQCIREVFVGVPEAQILTLIEETRTEDNALVAELGGELYAGVADGLRALGARYPLFIVSNSQSGYIESFLAWSGFGNLFREFECWGNTRLPKGRNLGDQVAARECRVPFAHVEYGFGDCADADQRFASFGELTAWLLDSGQGT
jgi:phosphoglycolate phosphatase